MAKYINVTKREYLINGLKADLIGSVDGWTFYEHPKYGDESSLMAISKKHGVFIEFSEEYELPEKGEFVMDDFLKDFPDHPDLERF